MGMGFSYCAHTQDKVAAHVGRWRAVLWRYRAEAGGVVATLSERRWHDRFQNRPAL
jgi:hypothetical protein